MVFKMLNFMNCLLNAVSSFIAAYNLHVFDVKVTHCLPNWDLNLFLINDQLVHFHFKITPGFLLLIRDGMC